MLRFRQTKSIRKFSSFHAAFHAAFHERFNKDRHLTMRESFKG